MIIATAGHVDHGKTALVRALTGQETDRTAEERRRGLSIELGYAWMELPGGGRIDLVDVPGHARFMRTLVAGVGCVDALMLVVAADDGLMPQTHEHLELLRMLELPLGLIVVSKCDRVSAERAREVGRQTEQEAAALGLQGQPSVHLVDSLSGTGMAGLRSQLAALAATLPARAPRRTRLIVDRSFLISGIGRVVTGTLSQGRLALGDQLRMSAIGAAVRVRGLQVHGRAVDSVMAGQRCAVNLTGELPDEIERGVQLLDPDIYLPTTRIDFLLRHQAVPLPREMQIHLAGAVTGARLVPLKLPLEIQGAQVMQAILAQPLCCRLGDRLVLREPGGQRLIAGGYVLDPYPPHRGRNHPARASVLNALLQPHTEDQLDRLLAGATGILDLEWYRRVTHLPAARLDSAVEHLGRSNSLVSLSGGLVLSSRVAQLRQQIARLLDDWHTNMPCKPGIALPQLAQRAGLAAADPLLRLTVRQGLDAGELTQRGALLARADFVAQSDPELLDWMQRLQSCFEDAAPRPPTLGDLVDRLGLPRELLVERLERLRAEGLLVRLARNRYLTQESIGRLASLAQELSRRAPAEGFTTAEFRDLSGVGRNHSVAVLECLDRLGLTRRLPGDRRRAT